MHPGTIWTVGAPYPAAAGSTAAQTSPETWQQDQSQDSPNTSAARKQHSSCGTAQTSAQRGNTHLQNSPNTSACPAGRPAHPPHRASTSRPRVAAFGACVHSGRCWLYCFASPCTHKSGLPWGPACTVTVAGAGQCFAAFKWQVVLILVDALLPSRSK